MLPVQRITESHLISDRYILRAFYSDHYSWCQDITFGVGERNNIALQLILPIQPDCPVR
jgi:hypothetical protein